MLVDGALILVMRGTMPARITENTSTRIVRRSNEHPEASIAQRVVSAIQKAEEQIVESVRKEIPRITQISTIGPEDAKRKITI